MKILARGLALIAFRVPYMRPALDKLNPLISPAHDPAVANDRRARIAARAPWSRPQETSGRIPPRADKRRRQIGQQRRQATNGGRAADSPADNPRLHQSEMAAFFRTPSFLPGVAALKDVSAP